MAQTIPAEAILVPVDFSMHSKAALVFAAKLASRLGAPLVILHVVHDPGDAPGYYIQKDPDHPLRIDEVAAEMMEDFIDEIAKENPELEIVLQAQRLLISGLPVSRILEVAEQCSPLMVVMGGKGRTALSNLLLGSKSEQVIRHCPLPVTIVKIEPGEEE